MPDDRKFGGIKPASARPSTSRVSSTPAQKVKRRLQALTAEILEVVQEKYEQEVLPLSPSRAKETQIEESFTQSDAVLWFVNGVTIKDWKCRYGCVPVKLSRGATHHWGCEFWNKEGKNQTPIDRMKPPVT